MNCDDRWRKYKQGTHVATFETLVMTQFAKKVKKVQLNLDLIG
jgi:hypothetical protein